MGGRDGGFRAAASELRIETLMRWCIRARRRVLLGIVVRTHGGLWGRRLVRYGSGYISVLRISVGACCRRRHCYVPRGFYVHALKLRICLRVQCCWADVTRELIGLIRPILEAAGVVEALGFEFARCTVHLGWC